MSVVVRRRAREELGEIEGEVRSQALEDHLGSMKLPP